MEERIRRDLPRRTLEAAVNWHCRKGQRTWCNCPFCQEKKLATQYVGFTRFPWQKWDEGLQQLYPMYRTWSQSERYERIDYDFVAEMLIKEERERKRNIARGWLREKKGEVL